jgi:isocitrate dehydrogenase
LKVVIDLKHNVVIPYLKEFQIYWRKEDGGESFKKFINGWLPPDGIHAISNKNNRLIILIYLDSVAV